MTFTVKRAETIPSKYVTHEELAERLEGAQIMEVNTPDDGSTLEIKLTDEFANTMIWTVNLCGDIPDEANAVTAWFRDLDEIPL